MFVFTEGHYEILEINNVIFFKVYFIAFHLLHVKIMTSCFLEIRYYRTHKQ